MLLNKHNIFSIDDSSHKDLFIEEWNGDVRIRSMSIDNQITFEKMLADKADQKELIMHVILSCCVDDSNNQLFNKEDLPELHKKSPKALLKIFNAALEMNFIDEKIIEKKAKNS